MVRLAAIGIAVALRAARRADVLALMAIALRALSDIEIAGFAKIVLPRIGVVLAGGFIEHQLLVARLAAIAGALAGRARHPAAMEAVAPVQERLRIGIGRRALQRKADLRIDREIGMAGLAAIAGAGQDRAARPIGEVGRRRSRPLGRLRSEITARPRWLAADDAQRLDEALGDRAGFTARQALGARLGIQALDRHHIGHAELGEGIAHKALAHGAAQIGILRGERLHRLAFAGLRVIDVIGQQRAGDLHLDRLGEGARRQPFGGVLAGLERELRAVTGGAGIEQIEGAEARLIMADRQAAGHAMGAVSKIASGVEGQQHRHRTAADAGEQRRGDAVQLHDRGQRTRVIGPETALRGKVEARRCRAVGADLGLQLFGGRPPIDAGDRHCGGAELTGAGRAEQGDRQQESTSNKLDGLVTEMSRCREAYTHDAPVLRFAWASGQSLARST